jgi:putative nucleotidyltransferase with HDIG domain
MTPASLLRHRPSPRAIGAVPLACDLVARAREHERAGCIPEAIEHYEAAITKAEEEGHHTLLAEALRRLAIVLYQRDERDAARDLCNRSFAVALDIGNTILAGEALNTLGVMQWREGSLAPAKETLLSALEFGGASRELRARVEHNLGVVANIRGDLDEATTRYSSSLEEYKAFGDGHGCAVTYHDLGMVSADRHLFDDADRYFRQSQEIAEQAGDIRLQGLCLVNHADVHIARQRYEDARKNAEASLVIFDQLGMKREKADAYRIIGTVYRETGRLALAESRMRSAIELSATAGHLLCQAEATRELAVVYQNMGRNQEALTLLNDAHRLFEQLEARIDLVNVGRKKAELEGTYLEVVREWGQSIESSDTYTHGHCERVADNAVAVARALGLDEQELSTIRLGAYLHDLGKVKVPHEVLNKPGPLTRDEFEVMQMHPVWGVEMLADVEFPWDLKPIIRWHHEKYDSTGYPDRLIGDEIPLPAQVVGIVDVYDALTTTRSYRAALSHETAIAEIVKCRASWSPRVFDAFIQAVGGSVRLELSRGAATIDSDARAA